MSCSPPSRPSASSPPRKSPLWRCSCAATKPRRSPAPISAWTEAGLPPRLGAMRSLILLSLLTLSACGTVRQSAGMVPQWSNDWRRVATDNDRKRLRDWRKAFVDGLDGARKAGHGADITREGVLLDPDAALTGDAIPNGNYACRVIKLGAK